MSDILHIIFFVASLQGILMSVLIFLGRKRGHVFLALLFLSFSLVLLSWVGWWMGVTRGNLLLTTLGNLFFWAVGPSWYLYVRSAHQSLSFKESIWHYTPFLFLVLICSPWVVGKIFGFASQLPLAYGSFLRELLPWAIFRLVIIQMGCYLIYETWTEWPKIFCRKPKNVLMVSFALPILALGIHQILQESGHMVDTLDYLISIIISAGIYFLGFFAFFSYVSVESTREPYSKSNVSSRDAEAICDQCLLFLETSEAYLNCDLKLDDVASATGISKFKISQSLNQYKGVSFQEVINTMRVEKAKHMLMEKDKKDWKIMRVGIESGFKNKVTFYQYFKRLTGLSPAAFKDQQPS